MTETLKRVVAQIELLSPEQQDAIAEIMLPELEEREWDDLVAKPGSHRFLEQLADEARRENRTGEAQESTDCW